MIDASTTSRDITARPAPAATAAQIASFDGSSNAMRRRAVSTPNAASALSKAARVPEPFSRATHVAAARRSASRLFERRAGVAGGDDQQFVFVDRRRVKGGVVDLAFDKAEVDLSGSGQLGDRIGVADAQRDRDAGIAGVEGGDAARQPVAADRLAGGDRQRAGLEAGEIGERLLGRRGARQHRSRFAEEGAARAGQRDAPADAIEQLDPVPLLERRDRGARSPTG